MSEPNQTQSARPLHEKLQDLGMASCQQLVLAALNWRDAARRRGFMDVVSAIKAHPTPEEKAKEQERAKAEAEAESAGEPKADPGPARQVNFQTRMNDLGFEFQSEMLDAVERWKAMAAERGFDTIEECIHTRRPRRKA